MLAKIIEMFSYSFMVKAIIVGSLMSLCASLLGVSLVLKRYSMIGDGLSHVGFGALALASAIGFAPMQLALPVVVIAAILLLRLSEKGYIKGDAAIAIVSSSAVAFGVIVVALSSGNNIDVYNYLFGSILAVKDSDVVFSTIISLIVIVMYIVFYNRIFAVSFDETFARASKTKAGAYNMLIAVLTAMVIVVGMRLMGSMLISSLIIFPALTSMRLFKTFKNVAISSAVISLLSFFTGMFISFVYSLPSGACVVLVNLFVFCIFNLIRFCKKKHNSIAVQN